MICNVFPITFVENSELLPIIRTVFNPRQLLKAALCLDECALMTFPYYFCWPFSRFLCILGQPSQPPTSFLFHQSPACVSLHLRLHLAVAAEEYEMKLV